MFLSTAYNEKRNESNSLFAANFECLCIYLGLPFIIVNLIHGTSTHAFHVIHGNTDKVYALVQFFPWF